MKLPYRRSSTAAVGVVALTGLLVAGATASDQPVDDPTATSEVEPAAAAPGDFTLQTTYSEKAEIVNALAAQLGVTPVHTVMDNANHDRRSISDSDVTGLAGYETGFQWDSTDVNTCTNYPQGITTSRDAVGDGAANGRYDGRQIVVASWYTRDCSTLKTTRNRLTFADWDSNYPNKYRKVLLVEPTGTATDPNFTDIKTHAGGVVWYGHYVYVADTGNGMRIFDMRKILEVDTGGSSDEVGCSGDVCRAHNYRYVMPQVGRVTADTTSDTPLVWSTISFDRAKPSIVMTEYTCQSGCDKYPNRAPRAVRFPFASGSQTFAESTTATEALDLNWYNLNGVGSHNGRWWFYSSGADRLYYWTPDAGGHSYPFVGGGESISYWEDDDTADLLWTLQEHPGHRNVFAVRQASYDG